MQQLLCKFAFYLLVYLFIKCLVQCSPLVAAADSEMRLCHKSKAGDGWHRSHFGSHPRMIVTTQHSGVSLLDLRVSLSYDKY